MALIQFLNLPLFFLISFIIISRFIWLITFKKTRINLPPGPKALPIIGHLHLLKKPLHRTLAKLSQEHGDVMLLKLGVKNLVVVSSPQAVEECFTKNDVILANRNETVSGKFLNYNCSTIGLSSYGEYWRSLRRIAALEILSQHRLEMLKDIRQEEVNFLVKEICEEFHGLKTTVKVNMKSKLSSLTLNIMMRMIAGKRYYGKYVIDEEASQFQMVFKEMLEFHGLIVNLEDYFPIFRFLDFKGLKKNMTTLMKKIDHLLQNLIDEHHKDRLRKKNTFIDILLISQVTEPEFLTDQTIKAITLSLLAGGSETTATTLEWAISLLLNNPAAMQKALSEIQSIVGEEDRLIDESDLRNLNYLDSVITETLRLYPPVPLLLPHRSSENCEVAGYEIPKDSMLLANLWKIQRDPEVWDEPEKFMPERYAGEMNYNYKMLPFGAGRRACPGAKLGRRMVALTLGVLIQCFEMEKVGDEAVDMAESSGMAIPKETPLEVLCKPRKIALRVFAVQSGKE